VPAAGAGRPDRRREPWRDLDRRFKERRKGASPPWVSTIFLDDLSARTTPG
jgi:hypothetical protein